MSKKANNIFLSYSNENAFEGDLLQVVIESRIKGVKVWTYQRDQKKDERNVSESLKKRIKESIATIFLLSPSTVDGGATQWMELAYSDAFGIPTFILLHGLSYEQLKNKEKGVPPLLLSGQCNQATEWKLIETELCKIVGVDNG